ncbi:MAG: efflux RND transporter periplasmic adaptor subunit [Cytophagaceae bacterium]
MKSNLKNKYVVGLLILAAGILIGWFANRPAHNNHEVSEHSRESDQIQVWTCSMHPQIRSNEPGKCPLCGMELIPLQQNINQEANPYIHTMSPEAVALANIQTEKVRFVQPEHEITLSGKVSVNEKTLSIIPANYSGRIERLFVDVTGQQVQAGQKIATIYSPELITAQQELLEAAKTKDNNPVLYNAARQKLKGWNLLERQIDVIIANQQVQTRFDVLSNTTGVVLNRIVSEGDFISRGQSLYEVANLNSIWIVLDAYESDLSLIKVGSNINFTVPSVPGQNFTAKVDFIDPVINPQTRTASVRATFENKALSLKPEMFVNATIKAKSGAKQRSIVVPVSAVLWTGKRSVVYVKLQDTEMPSFEMREITLGTKIGELYIVESGLEEGEEVVRNGAFALDAAAQLNGSYSMMNRPENLSSAVPAEVKTQLSAFTKSYFNLKNALVDSDGQKSINNADAALKQLSGVEKNKLSGKARELWNEEEAKMKKSLSVIKETTDLEKQRKEFAIVSEGIIKLAKEFRFNSETAYVAYCPMANEDKGANWLSEFKEIRNPYFGKAMLSCGEVKETLRPLAGTQERSKSPQQHVH